MQNRYYFKYDFSCEPYKGTSKVHHRILILQCKDYETAKQRAENYIKKRPLFTGNVDEYNLILTQVSPIIENLFENSPQKCDN